MSMAASGSAAACPPLRSATPHAQTLNRARLNATPARATPDPSSSAKRTAGTSTGTISRMTPQEARELMAGTLPAHIRDQRLQAALATQSQLNATGTGPASTSSVRPDATPRATAEHALPAPRGNRRGSLVEIDADTVHKFRLGARGLLDNGPSTDDVLVSDASVHATATAEEIDEFFDGKGKEKVLVADKEDAYRALLAANEDLASMVAAREAREREEEERATTLYQLNRFANMHVKVVAAVKGFDPPPRHSPPQSPRSPDRQNDDTSFTPPKINAMTRKDVEELVEPKKFDGIEDRVMERYRAAHNPEAVRLGLTRNHAQRWTKQQLISSGPDDAGDEVSPAYNDATTLLASKAEVHRMLHQRDQSTQEYVLAALETWSGQVLGRVDRNDQFDAVLIELLETVKDQTKLPVSLLEELLSRLDVGLDAAGMTKMLSQLDPRGRGEVPVDAFRTYWHRAELSTNRRKVSAERAAEALALEFPVPSGKRHAAAADKKVIPFHNFVGWLGRMGAKIDQEDAALVYTTLQPLTRARALSEPIFSEIQQVVQRVRAEQSEATNDLALARRLQEVETRATEAASAFDNFVVAGENASQSQRKLDHIHTQLKQQASAAAAMGRLAPVRYVYTVSTNTDVSFDDNFTELWESVTQQLQGGASRATKGLPNALEMKEEKLQQALSQLKTTTAELIQARTQLETTTAKLKAQARIYEAEKDVRETHIQYLDERIMQLSDGPGVIFADPRFGVEIADEIKGSMVELRAKLRNQVVDHSQATQKLLREVANYRERDEEHQQTIVVLRHRLEKIKADMAGDMESLEAQLRSKDEALSVQRADLDAITLRAGGLEHRLEETRKSLEGSKLETENYKAQVDRLLRMQKSLVTPDEVERRVKTAVSKVKVEFGAQQASAEALQKDIAQLRNEIAKEKKLRMEAQVKAENGTAQIKLQLSAAASQRDAFREALRSISAAWVDSLCSARSHLDRVTEIDDAMGAGHASLNSIFAAADEALTTLAAGDNGDESDRSNLLPGIEDIVSPLQGLVHEELHRDTFETPHNKYLAEILELQVAVADAREARAEAMARLTAVDQERAISAADDRNLAGALNSLAHDLEELISGSEQDAPWDPMFTVDPSSYAAVAGPRWHTPIKLLSIALVRLHKFVTGTRRELETTTARLEAAEVASRTLASSAYGGGAAGKSGVSLLGKASNKSKLLAERGVLDRALYVGEGTAASPLIITAPDAVFESLHDSVAKHEEATAKMLTSIVGKIKATNQAEKATKQRQLRRLVDSKIHNAVSRVRERVAVRWIQAADRVDEVQRQRLVMDAHATFDADRADVLQTAVNLVMGDTDDSTAADIKQIAGRGGDGQALPRRVARPGQLVDKAAAAIGRLGARLVANAQRAVVRRSPTPPASSGAPSARVSVVPTPSESPRAMALADPRQSASPKQSSLSPSIAPLLVSHGAASSVAKSPIQQLQTEPSFTGGSTTGDLIASLAASRIANSRRAAAVAMTRNMGVQTVPLVAHAAEAGALPLHVNNFRAHALTFTTGTQTKPPPRAASVGVAVQTTGNLMPKTAMQTHATQITPRGKGRTVGINVKPPSASTAVGTDGSAVMLSVMTPAVSIVEVAAAPSAAEAIVTSVSLPSSRPPSGAALRCNTTSGAPPASTSTSTTVSTPPALNDVNPWFAPTHDQATHLEIMAAAAPSSPTTSYTAVASSFGRPPSAASTNSLTRPPTGDTTKRAAALTSSQRPPSSGRSAADAVTTAAAGRRVSVTPKRTASANASRESSAIGTRPPSTQLVDTTGRRATLKVQRGTSSITPPAGIPGHARLSEAMPNLPRRLPTVADARSNPAMHTALSGSEPAWHSHTASDATEQPHMSSGAQAAVLSQESLEATRAAIRGATARLRAYLHRQAFPLKKINIELDEDFVTGCGQHRVLPFDAVEALMNAMPAHYRLPGVRYVLLAMLSGLSRETFTHAMISDHFVPPMYTAVHGPALHDLHIMFDAAVICGEILLLGKRVFTTNITLGATERTVPPSRRSPVAATSATRHGMAMRPGDPGTGGDPSLAADASAAHPLPSLADAEERDTLNKVVPRASSASFFRRPFSAGSTGGSSAKSVAQPAPAAVVDPTGSPLPRTFTPANEFGETSSTVNGGGSPVTSRPGSPVHMNMSHHKVSRDDLPLSNTVTTMLSSGILNRSPERLRSPVRCVVTTSTYEAFETPPTVDRGLPVASRAVKAAMAARATSDQVSLTSPPQPSGAATLRVNPTSTTGTLHVYSALSEQRSVLQRSRTELNEIHASTHAT
jgi:hypothetical protein